MNSVKQNEIRRKIVDSDDYSVIISFSCRDYGIPAVHSCGSRKYCAPLLDMGFM